jgi:hypothetical protein
MGLPRCRWFEQVRSTQSDWHCPSQLGRSLALALDHVFVHHFRNLLFGQSVEISFPVIDQQHVARPSTPNPAKIYLSLPFPKQ